MQEKIIITKTGEVTLKSNFIITKTGEVTLKSNFNPQEPGEKEAGDSEHGY